MTPFPSLPPSLRYATACALAGVNPDDAVAGVPNIDSLNVWPALTTSAASPRTEIPLSYCTPNTECDEAQGHAAMVDAALIQGPYKIVTGYQGGVGFYQGPLTSQSTQLCALWPLTLWGSMVQVRSFPTAPPARLIQVCQGWEAAARQSVGGGRLFHGRAIV